MSDEQQAAQAHLLELRVRMIRLIIIAGVIAVAVFGMLWSCSSNSKPTSGASAVNATADTSKANQLVAERYADCLSALKATPPVMSGIQVTSRARGVTLTWGVGVSKTGTVLTPPANQATTALLESTGCM